MGQSLCGEQVYWLRRELGRVIAEQVGRERIYFLLISILEQSFLGFVVVACQPQLVRLSSWRVMNT